MGILKNFVTPLHKQTKRNYVERMTNNKVYCSEVAKKYGKDYWDGKRKFGYGGYKYIPGRWKSVAKKIIKTYNLKPGSRVIDIGCGKGFLLYEMILLQPKLLVSCFDISRYALTHAKKEIKDKLFIHDVCKKTNFKNKKFDLAISLGTLHNLKLKNLFPVLKEIERISKKNYIMVESYRNNKELFNLQCWALTAETIMDTESWKWILKKSGYLGDYEFIYFN